MALADFSATDALAFFRSGEASPVELVEACLERIAALDPELHAVVTLCEPGAREAARTAEARWRSGEARPLEGIPFGAKDVLETRGVRTTAGSRLYLDHVPATSATVVE